MRATFPTVITCSSGRVLDHIAPARERTRRDQGLAPLAWLYAFKARAKNVIAQILPEPQASLLTGILLGDDSGITHDVQDAFRATGTSHIIAISGYNVTILMG